MTPAPTRLAGLRGLDSSAFWAGVTAFIFMVFGALTVQLSVLRDFGITESQQSSWITITWLTAGLVTLPIGERAELLRTIAQNLDAQGIRLDRLAEISGGYRVTGAANGNYISQWYTIESLRSPSQERRSQRSKNQLASL